MKKQRYSLIPLHETSSAILSGISGNGGGKPGFLEGAMDKTMNSWRFKGKKRGHDNERSKVDNVIEWVDSQRHLLAHNMYAFSTAVGKCDQAKADIGCMKKFVCASSLTP